MDVSALTKNLHSNKALQQAAESLKEITMEKQLTKEETLLKVLTENQDKISDQGAVHTDVMLEAMEEWAKETLSSLI